MVFSFRSSNVSQRLQACSLTDFEGMTRSQGVMKTRRKNASVIFKWHAAPHIMSLTCFGLNTRIRVDKLCNDKRSTISNNSVNANFLTDNRNAHCTVVLILYYYEFPMMTTTTTTTTIMTKIR